LVILPIVADEPTLEDLLALITEENRHDEVDTGPAQGGEQW
jgi:antitoxin component of MazEF toxin-antitoxin module